MICTTLNEKTDTRMNRFYSLLVCLTLLFPAVLKAQEIPVYTIVHEQIDSAKTIAFSSLMYMTSWEDYDPNALSLPAVAIPELL